VNRTLTWVLCVLVVACAMTGCSKRQQEWETARTADNIESYEGFLKSYPEGEFTSQAQARVKELQEARDWQQAIMTDTPEGYQQFLNQYPEGRMSDEARIRIENFVLAETPSAASLPSEASEPPATGPGEMPVEPQTTETAPPSSQTQKAPPAQTAPAPSATTKVAIAKDYRVQLGAFSGGEKQAMAEWRKLRQEYPKYLGSLSPSVKLATTTSGHIYRLQAGMTNVARAREICAALKAKGQACVVVKP
jgi:cell division protein FtsN